MKQKLIRITTVPMALGGLLRGQLRFMSEHYEVIGVSSSAGDSLAQVGEREGISVFPIEMTRKITPFKDLIATWRLYRFFRKERPDIVHSHTPKAGTLGMLAAFLAGVPYRLHTVAGLPLMESTGAKRLLLDFVEKITYRCATKIYPNSFGLKKIILANGYTTESKLSVLGNGSSNGIDTAHFDPDLFEEEDKDKLRDSLGLSKHDFIYIFVGRMVTDKGINELVTSFDAISSTNNGVKLILVGDFEKKLDPINKSSEQIIDTNTNIVTVGWQLDVRPYFAISDCLVFPSYREGFPNVVMQAGAMGLKSIVTNINGCNEIIDEGENGTIIPPKNIKELTLAMERYLRDSHVKNNSLCVKCRKMIVQRYDQQSMWNATLHEYVSLK